VVNDSTLEGVRATGSNRRGVIGRRIALSLMALAVLIGASGYLGVKARTIHASGNGYRMTLTYPQVARAGLDIPWRLTVYAPPAGFPKQMTIAVSNRYWDILEYQDLHPAPASETSTPLFIYLAYAPAPHSRRFSLSLDTYIQPASQVGRSAMVQVLANGQVMTQLHYKTWLVP
jgi:hypothetical protein